MDNIFYAAPDDFSENRTTVTIRGQEAHHISKVLRKKVGDTICVGDGAGQRFRCSIMSVTRQSIMAECLERREEKASDYKKILALGALKKRDRLEFAIEKAVELGATEICLFNADHSERSRVKEERLQLVINSAFKQSGRFWLPDVLVMDSLQEVLRHYDDCLPVMAHEKEAVKPPAIPHERNILLLVGPEGGFSEAEVEQAVKSEAHLISLGKHRLRAETAVTAILSQLLFNT